MLHLPLILVYKFYLPDGTGSQRQMPNKDLLSRGPGFLAWGEIISYKMELSQAVMYWNPIER